MSQLTIHVNHKPYVVGCEDGEEPRLKALAAAVDEKVRDLAAGAGQAGETRLMLLGALMLADELEAANRRLAGVDADIARLEERLAGADERAVAALEAAAARIESLVAR
ncbi:MAG: cell division protein ZapA [Caulobacteraceae bacterium]